MKKVVCFLMTVMLLLGSVPVLAETQRTVDADFKETLLVDEISPWFLGELREMGLNSTNGISFSSQMAKVNELLDEEIPVIVVSRVISENEVQKDFIFPYDSDGNLIPCDLADIRKVESDSSSRGSFSSKPEFIIVASGRYNLVWYGSYAYYQPKSLLVNYQERTGFVAGNFIISATYSCQGVLAKNEPTLTVINPLYSHTISARLTNPAPWTNYWTHRALPSTQVIDVTSGPIGDHYIYISGTYNGQSYQGYVSP